MAISVFKTFVPGEILTASDLNSSLLQIVNNGQDVPFPRTKDAAMAGFSLTLDADGNTSIRASTDNQVDVSLAGTDRFSIRTGGIYFDGVKIEPSATSIRQSDMRTASLALAIGEIENHLAMTAEFFSAGGM